MTEVNTGQTIYENALSCEADVQGFALEGDAAVTFPLGRMRMENLRDPEEGQKANFVFWCPRDMPDNILVSWDFWPIREPGLAMTFFAAKGLNGEDVLSGGLKPRDGQYGQYNHGDFNTLHLSYFRRRQPSERVLHTCNLRKSYGFHLVAQGADPIPAVSQVAPPYHIKLLKAGPLVRFWINDIPLLRWEDDGETHGAVLTDGKIGFRQMAPLMAEYANLQVQEVTNAR